ncbi:MAG: GTPase ObgE [Anaerolineae bacterium]|nr:GTPase ObgE [Anaerolineae bacterium]
MFFDEAKIRVKAGRGGNGCVAFRREKYVPRGGPSGGNGGKGGDVFIRAVKHKNTLLSFEHQNYFAAQDGQNGRGKDLIGRSGESLVIDVPLGTVVRDLESGSVLADLVVDGQQLCVAQGGRGGRGNAAFATSTNQAPRISEKGEPGKEYWLKLELKLIADVGLVGMPNAGKSTLLATVSAAKPKIASYPFTTLQPNLGVVVLNHETSFVMADLPGLIEGASEGTGLGYQFLRHVERTRLLVHLLDGTSGDPLQDFDMINRELAAFSAKLAEKPQIVVLNKIDITNVREVWPLIKEMFAERGIEPMCISAATGEEVRHLLWKVVEQLQTLPAEIIQEEVDVEPQVDEKAFTISKTSSGWRVRGIAIERAAIMANWNQEESAARFQRILEALGITLALREAGVVDGDMVSIGKVDLQWGWSPDL